MQKVQLTTASDSFLKKYKDLLLSISDTCHKEKPDYILALSRKAPRLIELMRFWGIWKEEIPIISEKALDFMSQEELEGKKIIIFDDIIISGTTIQDLLSKLAKKYDAKLKVVSVAIDKETIAVPKDDKGGYTFVSKGQKFPIDYKVALDMNERYVFCSELVRSFVFLNKPYDVDHSIFHNLVDPDTILRLLTQSEQDEPYNLTTVYQSNNGLKRYTFIPADMSKMSSLFNSIFITDVNPKISKVRAYYNERTRKLVLAPIVTFRIRKNHILRDGIFTVHFSWCNDLINRARKFLGAQNIAMPLYRLMWYIASYLFGLAFYLRNSTQNHKLLLFSLPSQTLHFQDMIYLFGPSFSKTIIEVLDSHFTETLEKLKELQNTVFQSTKPCATPFSAEVNVPTSFDKKRMDMYKKIEPYLDSIRIGGPLAYQMAAISEGCYYLQEIPTEKRLRKFGIRGRESERLKIGFNYEQIRELLHEKKVISKESNTADLRISLALDFLVDAGIKIPIFYETDDGFLERVYRYGEDALSAKQYGYLIASVTKNLFNYMRKKGEKSLPKIAFEKTGVMLQEEIRRLGVVDALEELLGPEDRRLNIAPAYSRHGKILHILDESLDDSGTNPFMFIEWCEKEGIIKYDIAGIKYSDEYLGKIVFLDGKTPVLISRDKIASLMSLAILLYHVDRIIDRSKKSDFVIALTACNDHRSYLEAVRKELHLFFKSGTYRFYLPLSDTLRYSKDEGNQTKDWIKSTLSTLRSKSSSAVHGIRHKKSLWDRIDIISKEIERYFAKNDELRLLYEQTLGPHLDAIKIAHSRPMETPLKIYREKIEILGELCIRISSILVNLLELADKFCVLRTTKDGRIYKTDLRVVKNKAEKLSESVASWNLYIEKHSESSFDGIFVKDLPRISYIAKHPTYSRFNKKECKSLMNEVVPQIEVAYDKLVNIYNTSYAILRWKTEMNRLLPKTITLAENDWEEASYQWIIWYDIKDFSGGRKPENREKGKKLVKYLNEKLLTIRRNTNDGMFNLEEDDEKHVFITGGKNVIVYLTEIMGTADEYRMHVRIGVCCIQDTNELLYIHKTKGLLKTSKNHVLAKRLGTYLKGKNAEGDEYHSLILTKGVLYSLWNGGLPSEFVSRWSVLEKMEEYERLRGVENYVGFCVAKLNKTQKSLRDYA